MIPIPEVEAATTHEGWERTDLYRFFAYAFASPTRERYKHLSSGELVASLRQLWEHLECPG